MKALVYVVLLLSLAANAILAVSYVLRRPEITSSAPTTSAVASSDTRSTTAAGAAASDSLLPVPPGAEWNALHSGDMETTIANLRAAGFPERVVRRIVIALLDEQFDQRRRAIFGGDLEPPPYWEPRRGTYGLERHARLRELGREHRNMYKELMGDSFPFDEQSTYYARLRFGNLPPEKLRQLQQIHSDYMELGTQIRMEAGSVMMPWDRESLQYIESEQRADIEGILTPEELEQYELYSSRTANLLRGRLVGVEVSADEFRSLYSLQKGFDEKYDYTVAARDTDTMRARAEAERQLNEQIRIVLGEDRFVEYERRQDRGYQAASRIVENFNLPAENAVAVFELAREMRERATAVQRNRELPADERMAVLQSFGAEAREKLGFLLTLDGVDAYRKSGAGNNWLTLLEPRR